MKAFPAKSCEPLTEAELVGNGLVAAMRTAYGKLAAKMLTSDAVALYRSRQAAFGKKVLTEADASAVEAPLVLYTGLAGRLDEMLGAELREQRHVSFSWRSCWEPAEKPAQHHDAKVEQAAALFNLSAAWSLRGALPPRNDSEAIKAAARHFQLAAGALQAVEKLVAEGGIAEDIDLSDGALGALRALMLAQAQACFCEKAEQDGLGASTQVKLCLGAKQLYTQASDAFGPLKGQKKLTAWGAGG